MKNIVENQDIKNDKPVPLSYEQLKQRLDAVVAENVKAVAAAQAFADATEQLTEIIGDEIGMEGVANLLAAFAAIGSMPATDAALAEVDAKAIEKLIAKKLKQLEAMHPDTHAFGATAMEIRSQINELQAYVVELREGRV